MAAEYEKKIFLTQRQQEYPSTNPRGGMSDLLEYLKERRVPEENISLLLEDKIDAFVLPMMPDEQLKRYIPSYGDRLAVVAFCRAKTSAGDLSEVASASSGSGVLGRLTDRMRKRKLSGQLQKLDTMKLKQTRRIELGWMNYENRVNDYKQVRSQNGGGTRHLSVDKDITKTELLEIGKDLFFPNGVSSKGNLSDFQFQLKDFQLREIDNATVSELYEKSCVKLLRLYLFSKFQEHVPEATETTASQCPIEEHGAEDSPVNQLLESEHVSESQASQTIQEGGGGCSVRTEDSRCNDSGTPTIIFNRHPHHSSSDDLPDLCVVAEDSQSPATGPAEEHSPEAELPTIRPRSLRLRRRRLTAGITPATDSSGVMDLREILLKLGGTINRTGRKNLINVNREEVLSGTFKGFSRASFDPRRSIDVRFSGEQAIDDGGPKREFMRLCMRSIRRCSVFEGPEEAKSLALDYDVRWTYLPHVLFASLLSKKYELVGTIIACIVSLGGPFPSFMSERLYKQISEGFDSFQPTLEDLTEPDTHDKVTKILGATNEDEYADAVDNAFELIRIAGAVRMSCFFSQRDKLAGAIMRFTEVDRKREAFEGFVNGLKCCGLMEEVGAHKDTCRQLFVHTPVSLDAGQVDGLFAVNWATPNSNRKRAEMATQTFFRDWLQDLEEEDRLSDFLVFVTGFDEVPYLGFDPQPSLSFTHPQDYQEDDHRRCLPYANTCSLNLTIPVVPDYDNFKSTMCLCLEAGTVFTNK